MNALSTKQTRQAGFTLPEIMVAVALATLIVGGFMAYLSFSSKTIQSVTQQSIFNQKGGNTIELIQARVRGANSITNDSAGDTLTLTVDDNPYSDSDADGKTYNDTNHTERIQFRTNDTTLANNTIYYKTNVNSSAEFVLATSVRKIPGQKVFTLTNSVSVIINFGLQDAFTNDNYQSIEFKGEATLRNHL